MAERNRFETWTLALAVLGAIVLFPLLLGGGGMAAGGFGMLGGGMFLTPIILVALVVYLVYDSESRTGSTSSPDAMDTLRERYARGELTDEEYETRLGTLQNDDQGL
ncbi:SHOCT domain-containing protein [Halorhabdus rudnickae]|uniref:SHOCT domain-containing protein n=1 Tax=Halorhabdus rudnickae TaxID=1775544 RepID=UPI001083F8DD|nr:SHOCT domain-containing protein [Halorhabdus rudnickae]